MCLLTIVVVVVYRGRSRWWFVLVVAVCFAGAVPCCVHAHVVLCCFGGGLRPHRHACEFVLQLHSALHSCSTTRLSSNASLVGAGAPYAEGAGAEGVACCVLPALQSSVKCCCQLLLTGVSVREVSTHAFLFWAALDF